MNIYISIYVVDNLAGSGVGSGPPMGPEALKIKYTVICYIANILFIHIHLYVHIIAACLGLGKCPSHGLRGGP